MTTDRERISTNSYNPRLGFYDENVKRGTIYDANMTPLAYSVFNGSEYERKYPFGSLASHIIGYRSAGRSGIEATENYRLENVSDQLKQRIMYVTKKDEILADGVVLTIDVALQKRLDAALGTNKGAAIVMEPSTGRILAMKSYPDFDPNGIADNWEDLRSREDSPLLNRATQGLYPPGSTFKVVTTLAAMEKVGFDLSNFKVDCKGEANFQNKIIHCYNGKAHGEQDIHQAMANSCNTFFATLGKEIGGDQLRTVADQLLVNEKLPFQLPNSSSSVVITGESTESELVETAIGQGKTVVTPLYMACLYASIANNGMMMRPYIVDHYVNNKGDTIGQNLPKKFGQVMTETQAQQLCGYLKEVIDHGTGSPAAVSGIDIAGKTGTAENPSGSDHSWFIGFGPYESPQVVVAVVLENAKEGQRATLIAHNIFQACKEELDF